MRAKARRLDQYGGPPGWLAKSDPTGCDFECYEWSIHDACPDGPYCLPWDGIHDSTISLRFLGIILRFVMLEVSTLVFVFLQNAIREQTWVFFIDWFACCFLQFFSLLFREIWLLHRNLHSIGRETDTSRLEIFRTVCCILYSYYLQSSWRAPVCYTVFILKLNKYV